MIHYYGTVVEETGSVHCHPILFYVDDYCTEYGEMGRERERERGREDGRLGVEDVVHQEEG